MPIWNRKSAPPPDAPGIVGTVKLARLESDVDSLREGDIALVEHPELSTRQAQHLIDRKVRAVLNSAASSSGRVPNQGPQMLARAGILLIDVTSDAVWQRLRNGDTIRIHEGQVHRDDEVVASGTVLDAQRTTADLAAARSGLATRLDSLAANATDHIHREQEMLIGGAKVPRLRTSLRNRPVVVVSHAHDDAADVRRLKRYIKDNDPVLIGAGAGADVLLQAGHTPAIVVGALDNISDAAIRSSGEVVVTTTSGTLDMPERLERHGKPVSTFVSSGSDDDLAILLADVNGAAVIVHAGGPATLTEFLERPPAEVARMFVARLRAGAKIVDAKAVEHFTSQRLALWPVLLLLLAGIAAVGAAIAITPVGQDWFDSLGDQLVDLGTWIKGLFT